MAVAMFSFLGGGGRGGGAVAASFAVKRKKHRRTGRAGEGCWSPPKFWATQIFWAARENLGKASF